MIAFIIYASKNDENFVKKIEKCLQNWRIPLKRYFASAHKVPEKVLELISKNNKGKEPICYITVAGRSNALSGVIAANSIYPVIACPPLESKEDFMININSSLMMPSQVPVLTVLDPENAADAVARIFGLIDINMKKNVTESILRMKKAYY